MEQTVLRLTDFDAIPDSEHDTQPAMLRAIAAAGRIEGPVLLDCPQGCYRFYPDHALRVPYYITNTASEEENPDVSKTAGLLLKGQQQLTLEGNGSLFLFHGKQTMLILDGCTDIEIRNLHLDYSQPTVAEMTVDRCGAGFCEVSVHPDSQYELSGGRLEWIGTGWRFRDGPMQICDPVQNITWRTDNWLAEARQVEEISPHRLRFSFGFRPEAAPGNILQVRDGIRDQAGVFITESTGVMIQNTGIHFMHGLGIACQFSTDLSFRQLDLSPRRETGRTVAGFADFIHLSGCRGRVQIEECRFSGAHDDAVNIHGTYLRITGQAAEDALKVRFMHPQTYGFMAFRPGDELEFIRADSLAAYARSRVITAEQLNPREQVLMLEGPLPPGIGAEDVIENITWTPEVEIRGNHFSRIPTRGILVTTRRRTVILDNVFERMQMSAVLVAADAGSWYESGAVRDMAITGNRFISCGSREAPVIHIAPEIKEADGSAPVHRNIRIERNFFQTGDFPILSGGSTHGLKFKHNSVAVTPEDGRKTGMKGDFPSPGRTFTLTACTDAEVAENSYHMLELEP
ncbi:right-handed parallel beta-helix repeat-containing protein [Paenibacillus sp. MMS20-IR301]|uniref:alpha-1,3-galactosidase-related protein n=1 Tax=Paenibacillus sp. MMS20-IR301 TaxID=2895946 RepID=UPI0028ECBC9E|nr:right-handed parallel beta-helix repeat-containing protein [Paenibacillus sp. MMS20-IR301]WNS46714.1 right-handed parallel beta-helix repeat-containing protein [Paenibacillus sp. MMS20-IR301]